MRTCSGPSSMAAMLPATAATMHHTAAQQTWELYGSSPSRSRAYGNTWGPRPTMDKRSITASAFSGQDRDEHFGPPGESMHRPLRASWQFWLDAGQHILCGIQTCRMATCRCMPHLVVDLCIRITRVPTRPTSKGRVLETTRAYGRRTCVFASNTMLELLKSSGYNRELLLQYRAWC